MTFTVAVIAVFLSGFALDFLYTRWFLNVASGKALKATAASMGIGALGLVGVTGVVGSHWLAIPYLLGLGLGTYVGVKK
jgi:hypothetical protein